MARELTKAAQVAKLCKQYLKARGIACTVSSKNFSMGSSVTVHIQDVAPGIAKEIEAEFSKYEYGRFDGMTDCYEYTNRRSDIPQVKYLHINNGYSDALKQSAWNFLRNRMGGYDVFPAEYHRLRDGFYRGHNSNYNVTDEIYHVLNGIHQFSAAFYDQLKAA